MKRLVYVPFSLLEDGEIPASALDLAKETLLSIQIGEEGNDIEAHVCVLQVPELRYIDYKETVKINFIQSIDYTNEYVVFSYNTSCKVTKNNNHGEIFEMCLTPVLLESHLVKYRNRFSEAGVYNFVISTENNGVLHEGKFEVV